MQTIHTPVKRSREYEETLQKLGSKESKIFPTLREALTFCAVLGFKERRRRPLSSGKGTEDIAAAQYHGVEAVNIMFALALAETGKIDILRPENESECVKIYEEFANGGLELVQSWIDRYADIDIEQAIWRGLQSIGVKPTKDHSVTDVVIPEF